MERALARDLPCDIANAESLDALDGHMQDAERWALRQTCRILRARYADKTMLSLRQRPELLPHAIENMGTDDATKRAAAHLCAEMGDMRALSMAMMGASSVLMTEACLIAAKAGRLGVLRYVRGLGGVELPWSLPWQGSCASLVPVDEFECPRMYEYNVIEVAVLNGHMGVAEQARLKGCPLRNAVPIEACMSGDVVALEWFFAHAPADGWDNFMLYLAIRRGHMRVLDWAAARGIDLEMTKLLSMLDNDSWQEQRQALLRWMAARGDAVL